MDVFHSMILLLFRPLWGGKVLCSPQPLTYKGWGAVISFEAGCRPLELPCLILKHLSLKKARKAECVSPIRETHFVPLSAVPEHLPFHLPFFSVRSTLEAGSILHSECGR